MINPFRKVDVKRPPKITFAIGLCISLPGRSPLSASGISARALESAVIKIGFNSPKYDVPDSLQTTKTDFRTTVYWNPQIQTDSTGHAKVSFYTTDMKHDMDYVLEGITEKGIPCRATGRIKAKKE